MEVIIRPETAKQDSLINMLQFEVTKMINKLQRFGYPLADRSVKIWVKEYNSNFYPKIEFDVQGQELQYDMTPDGEINEAHFKQFVKNEGKTYRQDLNKENADPLLIRLDNIIRFTPDDYDALPHSDGEDSYD